MQATFTGSHTITDGIVTYQFMPQQPFHYSPGQYIELTVPHVNVDERGDWRQLTLSSSPAEPQLAVTIRHHQRESTFKRTLEALRPGDVANITQAMGDFVLPLSVDTPLVWLAGGIGITPFHSMAAWLAAEREQRPIRLMHFVKDTSDAIYADVFAAAGIPREVIISDGRALASASAVMEKAVTDDGLFYISGPEPFVEHWSKLLAATDEVQPYQIVTDAFLGYR